jgi:hypothetical protein
MRSMNFVQQKQTIRSIRPSGLAVGKQAGTKQGAFRQISEMTEQHVTQVCEKHKNRFCYRPFPTCKQATKVRNERKARLEKPIAKLKAEQKRLNEQLKQAGQHIKETLKA